VKLTVPSIGSTTQRAAAAGSPATPSSPNSAISGKARLKRPSIRVWQRTSSSSLMSCWCSSLMRLDRVEVLSHQRACFPRGAHRGLKGGVQFSPIHRALLCQRKAAPCTSFRRDGSARFEQDRAGAGSIGRLCSTVPALHREAPRSRGQRRQMPMTLAQSITPSPQAQPTAVPVTFPRSSADC